MKSVLVAAAWPGESIRGSLLPALIAGAVTVVVGPRAGMWQLAAWGVAPVGEALKWVFHRPRPLLGHLNPVGGTASGSSLPSTHVSNYTATLGFASWILWRRRSRLALPASGLALALIGLIGPSRVVTGDHRWSDVAGGYATGLAYLAALIVFAKRDQRLDAAIVRSVLSVPHEAAAPGGQRDAGDLAAVNQAHRATWSQSLYGRRPMSG